MQATAGFNFEKVALDLRYNKITSTHDKYPKYHLLHQLDFYGTDH